MSEKEFLVDAVVQFLQQDTWLNAVSGFLEDYYSAFVEENNTDSQEKKALEKKETTSFHSLEQYHIFNKFKDMVEKMLEGVIQELGCSGEDLVSILQETVASNATTSRQGERRFFIKTLLSFDDFQSFYERITKYAQEKYPQGAPPRSFSESTEEQDFQNTEDVEWALQTTIAKSLVEAQRNGTLEPSQESLIPWAQALVEMNAHYALANLDASTSSGSFPTSSSEQTDVHYKELEHNLIRERLKVDLLVAQRIADSNADLKKQMLHLTADFNHEAGGGTSEEYEEYNPEEELAKCFQELETLQDRLQQVKSQCFNFKQISSNEMDHLYLFLKEKIHYKQDLASQQNEISTFVFSQLSSPEDAAVIPLLLQWLLLESEGLRLQNRVQELVSGSSVLTDSQAQDEKAPWTQIWDPNTQSYYYFNKITGESSWTPPAQGYWDVNGDYQYPLEQEEEQEQTSEAKEVKGENWYMEETNEDAINQYHYKSKQLKELDLETMSPQEVEVLLMKISQEHEEEKKRLEITLQVEKARQKEELQKRKEKKRLEKKLKKQKQNSSSSSSKNSMTKHQKSTSIVDSSTDLDTGNSKEEEEEEEEAKAKAKNDKAQLEEKVDDDDKQVEEKQKEDDDDIKVMPVLPLSGPVALAPIEQPPKSARLQKIHQVKEEEKKKPLEIRVPGHGRIDLTHLLSDSHARRRQEIKTKLASEAKDSSLSSFATGEIIHPQAFLNPTSLKYLTEQFVLNQSTTNNSGRKYEDTKQWESKEEEEEENAEEKEAKRLRDLI